MPQLVMTLRPNTFFAYMFSFCFVTKFHINMELFNTILQLFNKIQQGFKISTCQSGGKPQLDKFVCRWHAKFKWQQNQGWTSDFTFISSFYFVVKSALHTPKKLINFESDILFEKIMIKLSWFKGSFEVRTYRIGCGCFNQWRSRNLSWNLPKAHYIA